MRHWLQLALALLLFVSLSAHAQSSRVTDIATRSGVKQRVLLVLPPAPKATVVLFPGGHGGLQLFDNGTMKSGNGNFLVRSRQMFVDQGLAVAVVDAPSDRQTPPFFRGFRSTAEHAADTKAVIAWLRENIKGPVWLVGTSRGTQSAAYAATVLEGAQGPDGIVLTSSVLTDTKEEPVPAMALEKIRIPVLVVHHEKDVCPICSYKDIGLITNKLTNTPKKELLTIAGGESRGEPCEAWAHHGYNGVEREVVQKISAWILAP
jgi:pimeloyl-ACP methyl ester carboxylesterase